jgi:beta-glucosidase
VEHWCWINAVFRADSISVNSAKIIPILRPMDGNSHFNEIDGIPASGNHWLLTDLLREEWGFEGWIVTDYTSVTEMIQHGTAANANDAAKQALNAGVDMDMVSEAFVNHLPSLFESGEISESRIDAAVMRVLETKWDLGLFQDAFARCDETRAKSLHLSAAHRQLAREAARESIVLLKNEPHLLPLAKKGTIAVIGPLAQSRRDMLGCWIAAGDEAEACSALDGIREAVAGKAEVTFATGCEIDLAHPAWLAEAVQTANKADTIVLVLGESWQMNGEAASRTDIRLPKCQRQLAAAILKTGKPCVLVTLSGRPLALAWEDANFDAILQAWALGTEGGRALADIVFGDAAPVGKLTMGFPQHIGQLPMTYREKPTGRPFDADVQYSSKYLDAGNEALYPFGHGLTYGKFQYGAPIVDSPEMHPGGSIRVSTEITNLRPHPATETLQLYLRDLVASVSRPVKELRGYQRITLAAGEKRLISFEITDEDLSFPGRDFKPVVESGEFEAMTGPSSANIKSVRFSRL